MTKRIATASIDAGARLRTLDPAWVDLLAEDIKAEDLHEPIRVVARGSGFALIDGARRIAAHEALGIETIPAIVQPEEALRDDAAVRLGEIKSHMLRGELTALDRAVTVSAWCDVYKAANGTAKKGRKSSLTVVEGSSNEALDEISANLALNWDEAAQHVLGLSRRHIFRALKVARIEASVRSDIALLPIASNQSDLIALADETPVRQQAIARLLVDESNGASTYTAAIALLDETAQTTRKPAAYEKLSERFCRLDRREQEKFFSLHRDAIHEWLAKRSTQKAA